MFVKIMSDLPSQQNALFLESPMGKFALGRNAVPKPGRGQLVIKIKAIGLNPLDYLIQKNEKYSTIIKDYPTIMGADLSGDVAAVGEGVTKFKVGDKM
jgi:NADPH:quinone reductase-like Zn-dependent oxidoreductase